MTPFGKMVTPNITPDKETGIGNYTAEDFHQAMKAGLAPGGKLLYPAMPYPSYARDERCGYCAMWSYMKTVKPVKKSVNVNQLKFPFNLRFAMRGWNMLFFAPAPYANGIRTRARNGIAAPIWSAAPAIAAPATRPRMRSAPTKRTALTGARAARMVRAGPDQRPGRGAWLLERGRYCRISQDRAEQPLHGVRPHGRGGGEFHLPDE